MDREKQAVASGPRRGSKAAFAHKRARLSAGRNPGALQNACHCYPAERADAKPDAHTAV